MNIKLLILVNLITILLSSGQFNFQAEGELLEYQEEGITINKLTQNVEVFNDSLYLKTDQAYNYKELNKLHLLRTKNIFNRCKTINKIMAINDVYFLYMYLLYIHKKYLNSSNKFYITIIYKL